MSDKVFNIIIKLTKEGGADSETVQGLLNIKNAMVAGTAVIGGMTAAYYTADKVLKATVGEFATYAKDVDIFSSALSTTSEQGSRLIQIGDQLGISTNQLQTDLFRAVKNGMDPTVEGLAKVADAYVALKTPQEQADFMTKMFGRSSQELARLLQDAGAGIRDRNAAVQDGLVLDAAAIQKQREYEAALNGSAAAIKALKVELGGDWMPFWTNLVIYAIKSVEGWHKALDALSFNKSIDETAQAMAKADGYTWEAYQHTESLRQKYLDLALAADVAAKAAQNKPMLGPTDEEIAQLQQGIAGTQTAGADLTNQVIDLSQAVQGLTDKKVSVSVDSSGADPVLAKIQAAMDALVDKTIHIKVVYDTSGYIPQASGGDYLVNTPTLFLAGEAGPERATFTPAGGGGSTYNYNYGGSDSGMREMLRALNALPEKIGTELDKRIK